MKLFKDGMEIRLTQEDLALMLEQMMNEKLFILGAGRQTVSNLTLHPGNKYVARVTVKAERK